MLGHFIPPAIQRRIKFRHDLLLPRVVDREDHPHFAQRVLHHTQHIASAPTYNEKEGGAHEDLEAEGQDMVQPEQRIEERDA